MIQLIEPTLLLDKAKCLENIRGIVERARRGGVVLRPHFKTHQSREIGRWFRESGIEKITVSSLKMAEYFAWDDWRDITVAFPVNIHEIDRINSLAERITLNLLIVAPETIKLLASKLKSPLNVLIEIDSGDHRTGVDASDYATIDQILGEINRFAIINFKGFLTHAGHSYHVKSDQSAIAEIYRAGIEIITPLREKYIGQFPDLIISYGDTPTCSVISDFRDVDEIRPGNLVFYDLAQCEIGACRREQIAVATACPVVAKYPARGELVIYGGAIHLSKDFGVLPNGKRYYGKVVEMKETGWQTTETGAYLKSLSQEHGVISAPAEFIEKINPGDFIGILPVHSCLTADLNSAYLTTEGEKISKFRFYE